MFAIITFRSEMSQCPRRDSGIERLFGGVTSYATSQTKVAHDSTTIVIHEDVTSLEDTQSTQMKELNVKLILRTFISP